MGFLKKGKDSQKQMKKADEKAAKQAEGYINRFWMPNDAETKITFLDGSLDEDGMLDAPTYLEHQLNMDGSWKNWFACTGETEPCPICEGGDNPTLVAVLTIIDHTEWTDKKDKIHKDEKKLFVCKRYTIKQLQKIATKRGGLAGMTFEVSRIGEKAASVGDMYDYVGKRSAAVLKKKYKDNATVFDYEEVLNYKTAEELRAIGFGSLAVGSEAGVSDDYETEGSGDEYDEEL